MRIHNRFVIAILLPGLALLMSKMLLLVSNTCHHNLHDHSQYLANLRATNFRLANLTQEFVLYQSPRVKLQILAAHRQMGDQLASPPIDRQLLGLCSKDDHSLFASINNDHADLGIFLPMLLDAQSNLSGSAIVSTLLVKFQGLDSKISQAIAVLEQDEETLHWYSNLALIGGGLFLLVVLALCLLPLYRKLFHGLDILIAGAQRIGAGDFSQPIPETGTAEIDLLSKEFNHMRARLSELFNEQTIILNNIGIGVALLRERKLVWVNPAMRMIFAIPADTELTGKSSAVLYPDQESFLRFGEEAYPLIERGIAYSAEVRMLRLDGTPILCRLLGQAISPGHLEQGAIWVVEDITSRKAMEAEMVKARNLAAIGILAGGIAHDFNNLLQALLGNITLARMVLPESSDACQYLRKAEDAYKIGAKLTSRLIAFSSGGSPLLQRCQIAELIRKEVNAQTAGSGLELDFALNDDLREVACDQAQIQMVLQHLTMNAVEAMRHGGTLRVRAVNATVAAEQESRLAPGDYVQISIKDEGCGISKENLSRIFDPYFSTKPMGAEKGQGLGLSLAEAIVRKHGGMIKVESDSDGATFHVFLPAADGAGI